MTIAKYADIACHPSSKPNQCMIEKANRKGQAKNRREEKDAIEAGYKNSNHVKDRNKSWKRYIEQGHKTVKVLVKWNDPKASQ